MIFSPSHSRDQTTQIVRKVDNVEVWYSTVLGTIHPALPQCILYSKTLLEVQQPECSYPHSHCMSS